MSKENSKKEDFEEIKSNEVVVRVYGSDPTDVDVLNRWLEYGFEIIQVVEFKNFNCADYILKFDIFRH